MQRFASYSFKFIYAHTHAHIHRHACANTRTNIGSRDNIYYYYYGTPSFPHHLYFQSDRRGEAEISTMFKKRVKNSQKVLIRQFSLWNWIHYLGIENFIIFWTGLSINFKIFTFNLLFLEAYIFDFRKWKIS